MIGYLEAPRYLTLGQYEKKSIFVAGSITGARNWQAETSLRLQVAGFQVFNPRRTNYDSLIKEMEQEQVEWEYCHLQIAPIHLYWFSYETMAPITLFELGCYLEEIRQCKKKVYIGIHPDYKRKNDILIQTRLRAPLFNSFFNDLDRMINQIIKENT